jgi:ABC-type glycerol-3-phosphate transport system substrate-binding protein
MKSTIIILAVATVFAACGNGNDTAAKPDTLQPAVTTIDTMHTDTMVNNGERVSGRDTTGQKP